MHTDVTVWQMVIDIEREVALNRAARFGTLGEPPQRGRRLPRWMRREASPSPGLAPMRWGGESSRIVAE